MRNRIHNTDSNLVLHPAFKILIYISQVQTVCERCEMPFCREHLILRCGDCVEPAMGPPPPNPGRSRLVPGRQQQPPEDQQDMDVSATTPPCRKRKKMAHVAEAQR